MVGIPLGGVLLFNCFKFGQPLGVCVESRVNVRGGAKDVVCPQICLSRENFI